MVKKIILGIVILVFLSIVGLVLFFPIDSFVKDKIDETLGHRIFFKNLRISWNAITADDVTIKTSSGKDFLNIKQLKLRPSLWGLLKRKVEIKNIELASLFLTIKRDRNGRWLLPEFKKKEVKGSSFEFIVKSFEVDDGKLYFIDEVKGANLNLTGVEIEMGSKIFNPSKITINASGRFPTSGNISIKSEGDINTGTFKGVLSLRDMDMAVIKPYIQGDVKIRRGRLNLDSNLAFDGGNVKAPSVLRIKDLDIETKGFLMGVSAPLVIELVQKKGEIVINFNIWGKWNNLQNDLKESFQKKVAEGLGRTIEKTLVSPVEDVVRGISDLLPFKK
jgi:uncharacterized protein YhdP